MYAKYSARAIVRHLRTFGFSDGMIAKAIGASRVTIYRIHNGLQSGSQYVEDLNTLLRLSKTHTDN